MNFFVLIALSCLINLCASSQNQFGFFAGPQATTAHYTIEDVKQKTEFKYGFQAGVTMKVPFDAGLFFSPTAFYSMKGYKVAYTKFAFPPDLAAKDNNTTLHTFELAGLLQYDFGSQPGHVFIKAGPSLDFQLFGKEKYNLTAGGSVNQNMKFSFGDYGHFAANMLAQIGYETTGGIMIFAQYSHGIASISNADGGPHINHRAYGISIGKYFSRK